MAESRRSVAGLAVLVLVVASATQWWAYRGQAQLGSDVKRLAAPGDIRMLSSETCSICVAARQWLQQHGVAFSECTIERDAACARDLAATGAPGTPVFLVRGQPLVGFSPQRLRDQLQRPA